MAIIGIETLVYGVDDMDESTRFFDDYGLPPYKRSENFTHYKLAEGSNVHLRPINDPWFLKSEQVGTGVRECIWGVDTQEAFDDLIKDLERDHEIRMEADGTARFVTSFGQALGLKVYTKKPVRTCPSPSNSPGNANRINETRKWIRRPIPTCIQHVVWCFPDVNEVLDFYRGRLNFRLVDIQIGSGVYVKADGAPDHHNIFLADASLTVLGFDGRIKFHHANFGLEDIDEIMVAKNYMERRGWPKSTFGLGRHRISSGAFLYLKCPAGGDAEYGTDIDVLDDRWRPRIWEQLFGFHLFLHDLPPFLAEEPEWNVGFCDPMDYYPSKDTSGTAAAPPAQAAVAHKA